MVWIDDQDYVDLLRGAVHALELEVEARELEAATQQVKAEARALQMLVDRRRVAGFALDEGDQAGLLADLPLTAAGLLHEEAFAGLVEARIWAGRERALTSSMHEAPANPPKE